MFQNQSHSPIARLLIVLFIIIRFGPYILQGLVTWFILIPLIEICVFWADLIGSVIQWHFKMFRRLEWLAAQPGIWAMRQEQRLKERVKSTVVVLSRSIRERRLPRRSKRIRLPSELFYEIMRRYVHKADHLPYSVTKGLPETYIHFVSPPRIQAFIKVHEQQAALVEIQLLDRRTQAWARKELYRTVTICHWERFKNFLHLISEDLNECALYPAIQSAEPQAPLDVVEMAPAAELVRVLILAGDWIVGFDEATKVFGRCRWVHTCELELVRQIRFRQVEMLKYLTSLSISSVTFDTPWTNNYVDYNPYAFQHLRRLSLSGLQLDKRWGAFSIHQFFLSRPKLPSLRSLSILNCDPVRPNELEPSTSNMPSELMLGPQLAHQIRYLSIDRPYWGCGPNDGLDELELLNLVVNGLKRTTDHVFPFWDPTPLEMAVAQAARTRWDETLRRVTSTEHRPGPPVPRLGAREIRLQVQNRTALTPAFWTLMDEWLIERVLPSDIPERYRHPMMKLQRTRASHRLIRLRLPKLGLPKDEIVLPPGREMRRFLDDLQQMGVEIVWEASPTAMELVYDVKAKLKAARPFQDGFHTLVWGPVFRLDPRYEEEGSDGSGFGFGVGKGKDKGQEVENRGSVELRWEER